MNMPFPKNPLEDLYNDPVTGLPRIPNNGTVPEGYTPPPVQTPGTLNFSMQPITTPIANTPLVGPASPVNAITPAAQASAAQQPIQPEKIIGQKAIPQASQETGFTGPRFIPLTAENTTTTNQSQTSGVDAKSAAAIRQAVAEEEKATLDLAAVDAKKMGQTALSKEEQAAIQGQQLDAEKLARDEQRAKEVEAQKQLDNSAQDMLKYEFDQNRVWKRATTGGSIAAGIGIALGALAQGFGAKSNAALDAIDKQINRDIEQQRMEYEKIKDKTKAQESAYGRLRQLGFDDAQTRAQLNKASLDQIQTKLEVGLAKLGVEEAPLKAAQATAAARTKLEESLKRTTSTGSTTTKTKQTEFKQVPGMGGQGIGLRDYDGKLLSGDQAQKIGFMDQTLTQLERMESFINRGDNTYSLIGDNDFTNAMRIAAENYGRKQSGGAINKEEEDRFKSMMRGWGDITKAEKLSRIQNFKKGLLGERKSITVSPFKPLYQDDMLSAPVGNVK